MKVITPTTSHSRHFLFQEAREQGAKIKHIFQWERDGCLVQNNERLSSTNNYSPVFSEMAVATGVLNSNGRGMWDATFAEGVVGAMPECHGWGVMTGCHDWVPGMAGERC